MNGGAWVAIAAVAVLAALPYAVLLTDWMRERKRRP